MRKNMDKIGATGIGTMVVIIGLILVAVMSAGVLIHTGGIIGQQAEKTGSKSSDSVANMFDIIEMYGDRNDAAGVTQTNIQYLYIKVKIAAGSPTIDMSTTLIELQTKDKHVSLNMTVTDPDATQTNYYASELLDPQNTFDSTNQFVSPGAKILVKLNLTSLGMTMGTQTDFTIRILPKHGGVTYEMATCPDAYTYRYVDIL
jgi:archaellin